MSAKLIEPGNGGSRMREIPLIGEEFLIGRGADCDFRVHEEDISRHHCLIHLRGAEITLTDLGSSNGTTVNGQRVLSQVELKSGDEIVLGSKCKLIVDLGDVPGGVLPSDVDSLAITRKLDKPHRSRGEIK